MDGEQVKNLSLRRLAARLLFYPTLAWNLLLARVLDSRQWWNRVDEQVLIGALPFASHVPQLSKEGVGAVVNTCEEYAGPVDAYERMGISQLRIPTVDFVPPGLDDVIRAVIFMREAKQAGKQIYVHCKAGRGRSATVVICWLMADKGMTAEQAQAHLLSKRKHVMPWIHERVVVKEYARYLEQEAFNKI